MNDNTDSKRKKGKTGFIAVLLALLAILAFGGFALYNVWKFKTQKSEDIKREEIVPVEIAPVEIRQLDQTLVLTGDIRPFLEVNLHPKIPGKIIEKLYVEKGDFVKKGDLIARLEDDTIRAQISEAQASLRTTKAKLSQVEADLGVVEKDRSRMKRLVKKQAVSQQKMDQIDARHEAILAGKKLAIAQVERAVASLKLLKLLHKDHQILSPIDGYVSARYVDPGSMSDTKKALIRVSGEETVKIKTTITEQDYPKIKKGMRAELRVDSFPGKTFEGSVSVINPTLDPATRTGEIEIHVPNKGLILRSGMFTHIRLLMGVKETMVINKDALIRLPGTGSYYVYVVEDKKAIMKNLKIGALQEDYAEVKEGLSVAEHVVVKGHNRLKDGMAVEIKGQGRRHRENVDGGTK